MIKMIVIFLLVLSILFFTITGAYTVASAIFLLLLSYGLLGSLGSYLHSRKWNKLTPEQQKIEFNKTFQEHKNLQNQKKDIQNHRSTSVIYYDTYNN